MGATSSRAVGANHRSIIPEPVYVDWMRKAHDHIEGLRPRQCAEPGCGAMFAVCASCDRGQRYCSEQCRERQRRRQVHAAGKRYQAGEPGRRAHCRRQLAYRERQNEVPVTHQPVATITTPAKPEVRTLTQCAVCGQSNRWTNPFYRLVPRHRRKHRSARVQISTFSDDR